MAEENSCLPANHGGGGEGGWIELGANSPSEASSKPVRMNKIVEAPNYRGAVGDRRHGTVML
jgi:hypothetical protein